MASPEKGRGLLQIFRGLSLLVPAGWAWHAALRAESATELDHAVTMSIGPLWVATAVALTIRLGDALGLHMGARRSADGAGKPSKLAAIDVLTESGCAMAWLGAAAIALASWPSLTVVGLLGLCTVQVVAIWTMLRAGGRDPWRRASLSRRFIPSAATEGEPVIEELRFSNARIPIGFRLLAKDRLGRGWPTSRFAVEASDAGGEVVLEREVGPALRGEHRAELVEVWLQDVLGLCHSTHVHAGPAELTVLPRALPVEGMHKVLGTGGHDAAPDAEQRLPTEGTMRLREYQPGDDVRRIHWLRSLTAGQVDVRLPDEVPPDQPSVRLVLDTFLPALASSNERLACTSPDRLLDALVSVWLGVGRSLAEAGVRVTLVAAAARDGHVDPWRHRLTAGAAQSGGLEPALRLGARLDWQQALPVDALLTRERAVVVSFRLPAAAVGVDDPRWILVPPHMWAPLEDAPRFRHRSLLQYPLGSADNRRSRIRRERARRDRGIRDHAVFTMLTTPSEVHREGNFVARPAGRAHIRLEALS